MKLYIFICARVRHKCIGSPIIHSSTYRPSPTYNLQLTIFNVKTLFALLVTHEEKCPSRMPVDLKKPEFAPAGVQAGSSSRTFHPEVTGAGGKVQSKNYTGWNANSYINTHIYIYIYILMGHKVLWHINPCKLFYAKSYIYIYLFSG